MIISNKIKATIKKENIDKDYDIYRLSKEGKQDFFKNNVLDIPAIEFKAKSVVYTYGSVWYAMFEKGSVNKETLKKAINDESPDTRVEKVNILEEDIYENVLVHLILNAIYTQSDDVSYNNLTGKLYFIQNSWLKKDKKSGDLKSFYCLKLEISKDMFMKMAVQTFSKLDYFSDNRLKSKPKYIFDKETKTLRKLLKSDNYNDNEVYINKSLYPKKHNNVPFLDFKSVENFRKCKVGIYNRFLRDVEKELCEYITIENSGYEEYKTLEYNDKKFENKNYSELIGDKVIIVEDKVNNEESKKLCEKIILDLEKINIKARMGSLDKNSYNLRIIYSDDYYEKNELEDPYKDVGIDMVVQHITTESFDSFYKEDINENNKKAYPALNKILQELIIKNDILNNKISLANWNRCDYDTNWSFVKRKKLLYKKDGKNYCKHIYCKMDIDTEGKFNLKYYDDSEEYDLDWEFEYIQDAYNQYEKNPLREVEGLFYKSINNINTILRTEQMTMPDFKKLSKKLELSNGNKKVPVDDIINCLNKFNTDDEKVKEKKEEFLEEIKKFPKYQTIKEINKVLKIRNNPSKIINKCIYDETGILINPRLKDKEFRDEYFIPILDIKYFYKENKLYYFVGNDSGKLQRALSNACIIREVDAEEEIQFEEIMNLLKVEFVKNGQNTVVPFPFKYINEALAKI